MEFGTESDAGDLPRLSDLFQKWWRSGSKDVGKNGDSWT